MRTERERIWTQVDQRLRQAASEMRWAENDIAAARAARHAMRPVRLTALHAHQAQFQLRQLSGLLERLRAIDMHDDTATDGEEWTA